VLAPLSRRGWVSGSDSLINSLPDRADCATRPAISASRPADLSRLEPIVNLSRISSWCREAGDRAEDDGRAFLLHPALERFYPPEKRIVIPERLTVLRPA